MNANIQTVAKAYQIIALLLAVPSLIGTLVFGTGALRSLLAGPEPAYRPSGSNDSMARIFDGILKVVHGVGGLVSGIGQFITNVLAIVSVSVLLLATTLFFLGRGLNHSQAWARIISLFCMGALTLVSLLALLTVGRSSTVALLGILVGAGSAYAFWVLWQGYA